MYLSIPIGKAVTPVLGYDCKECFFDKLCNDTRMDACYPPGPICCALDDGKATSIIYKLVDYNGSETEVHGI